MKLKKIVSLALAGVLAVSMLAGCKNDGTKEPASSSEQTAPITGVAAGINAALKDNKDLISFTDNNDLKSLLDDYFKENNLELSEATADSTTVVYNSGWTTTSGIVNDVMNKLSVDESSFAQNIQSTNTANDKSGVEVFILSDKMSEDTVLKKVGQYIDGLNLPEEDANAENDYTYTGSVAMVMASTEGKTESAWVVAVVIDKEVSVK